MTDVRLEPPEIALACVVGGWRCASAFQKGRPAAYRYDGDPFTISIQGAAAEMAVAKYLGSYWQPLAPNGSLAKTNGDVGSFVQVRSTTHLNGSLILHQRDGDSEIFYLVVCTAPVYSIIGWLLGHEAKRPEFWREDGVRHPAFFAPQTALHECRDGAEVPDWIREYPR